MRYLALAAVLGFVASASAGTWYFDEDEYLEDICDNYFFEDFDWLSSGGLDPYTHMDPGGSGFGYYAHAPDDEQGLWGCPNPPHGIALSTNNTYDDVQLDFYPSELEVRSFGGWFYPSNIDCGWNQGQQVTLTLSDGASYTHVPTSITDFVGYIADAPLDWARISAPDDPVFNWVSVDHVYIDTPEPASLVLLTLGGLLIRRR